MVYCDAHLHAAEILSFSKMQNHFFCSCAHTMSDFTKMEKLYAELPFVRSFGVHPQNPDASLIIFLENLLHKNRIDAIGEAGFDMFCAEFEAKITEQEEVWKIQLELATQFEKPLIVHCRHSLDRIFRDANQLKKVPTVIFHSWPGSPTEAFSLLTRGINAYFSLGKPLLNNNKRALSCARELPIERLLLETDAPYQTLKGESFTPASDIQKVYARAIELRNESALCDAMECSAFSEQVMSNFFAAFAVSQDLRKSLLQGHW